MQSEGRYSQILGSITNKNYESPASHYQTAAKPYEPLHRNYDIPGRNYDTSAKNYDKTISFDRPNSSYENIGKDRSIA